MMLSPCARREFVDHRCFGVARFMNLLYYLRWFGGKPMGMLIHGDLCTYWVHERQVSGSRFWTLFLVRGHVCCIFSVACTIMMPRGLAEARGGAGVLLCGVMSKHGLDPRGPILGVEEVHVCAWIARTALVTNSDVCASLDQMPRMRVHSSSSTRLNAKL